MQLLSALHNLPEVLTAVPPDAYSLARDVCFTLLPYEPVLDADALTFALDCLVNDHAGRQAFPDVLTHPAFGSGCPTGAGKRAIDAVERLLDHAQDNLPRHNPQSVDITLCSAVVLVALAHQVRCGWRRPEDCRGRLPTAERWLPVDKRPPADHPLDGFAAGDCANCGKSDWFCQSPDLCCSQCRHPLAEDQVGPCLHCDTSFECCEDDPPCCDNCLHEEKQAARVVA